jgi:hypothetical protein
MTARSGAADASVPAFLGAVVLSWNWARETEPPSAPHSNDVGKFGERGRGATAGAGFDAEFVMPAPEVLQERVTAHNHAGAVVAV